MRNEDLDAKDQLEKHSLPGTNQAGKGAAAPEEDELRHRPEGEGAEERNHREKHSLPGTNQAGKGPSLGPR